MTNRIVIENVTKKFGETLALSSINLEIAQGRVYGLLGRNGAGKSTLLNLICNRIKRSEGLLSICGETMIDTNKAQAHVFLMSEKAYYPEGMKVKDIISYTSILKLILALSVNVDFVFLDEPVLGLDAHHRLLFYKKLQERINQSRSSFIISTHLIDEIVSIVQEIIIIEEGQILLNQSVEALLTQGYSVKGKRELVDEYCLQKNVVSVDTIGDYKVARIIGEKESVSGLEYKSLKLQDLFIALTNGGNHK